LKRVDVELTSPTGFVGTERRRMAGARATSDEIRDVLDRSIGLLSLHVHGTHWSVSLKAGSLALCMLHEPHRGADKSDAPYCVGSGYCPMVRQPVREALRTTLLDPDMLRARVLVIASCMAVPVGSPSVGAGWALLPQVVANPSVGAVLASMDLTIVSYKELSHHMLDKLEAGSTVQEASAAFEMAPITSRMRQRLLLFGDPRTCATDRAPTESVGPSTADEDAEDTCTGDVDIETIRSLSLQLRDDHPRSGLTAFALSQALDALEHARRRQDRAAEASCARATRTATLRHISTLRGRTPIEYRRTPCRREDTPTPCPACAWPVARYRWESDAGVRVTIHCPRCGEVADLPLGAGLDIEVEGPLIRLVGRLPQADWDGAVYLVTSLATEVRTYRWDAAADGSPEPSKTIKLSEWPSGPLSVRAVFISNLSLYSVARAVRGPVRTREQQRRRVSS
jgi:hypothetical protein